MEVNISELIVTQKYDFRDLDLLAEELEENKMGCYSMNLAQFVEEEKLKLRILFVPLNDPNRDAYIQVFNDSISLIGRTFEEIWCGKLEGHIISKNLDALEKWINELEPKFEDVKKEFESTSKWKKTWMNTLLYGKMEQLRQLLLELQEKSTIWLREKHGDELRISLELNKSMTLLEQHIDEGQPAGRLRKLLLTHQFLGHIQNRLKLAGADVALLDRIMSVKTFTAKWSNWYKEECSKFCKYSVLMSCGFWGVQLVLNYNNMDPCKLESAQVFCGHFIEKCLSEL